MSETTMKEQPQSPIAPLLQGTLKQPSRFRVIANFPQLASHAPP